MAVIRDRGRESGPGDGGPIGLLAVVAALAVVGSVAWALVFGF